MSSEKQCGWLEAARQAVYLVTPSDVIILGSKVGVAMNREASAEWLKEHSRDIEAAIDKYIQEKLLSE